VCVCVCVRAYVYVQLICDRGAVFSHGALLLECRVFAVLVCCVYVCTCVCVCVCMRERERECVCVCVYVCVYVQLICVRGAVFSHGVLLLECRVSTVFVRFVCMCMCACMCVCVYVCV